MARREIEEALAQYKQNRARIKVLYAQAEGLGEDIKAMQEEGDEVALEAEALGTTVCDGMPKQTRMNADDGIYRIMTRREKQEERLAAQRDGKIGEARALERRLRPLEMALEGLYDREKYVVEKYYLSNYSWNSVLMHYEREYGLLLSDRQIRRIGRAAMEKLDAVMHGEKVAVK